MIDATIEMVDGVMVVSPKEEKFEPKDGDVVTVTTETGGDYTCFFKGCVNGDIYSYGGLNNLYNMLFEIGLVCVSKKLKTIYPASEEEKQKLFDKLKEEGYEFDFEKKELVKLRWELKYNEGYWCPSWLYSDGVVPSLAQWSNSKADNIYQSKGWVFKTEEECQAFCDKLNQMIEGIKP